MFGVGIFEVLVILIVAVIALGPNKLPQAIVDIVKFFRALKKTISEAKDSFDKELELSQLKQEALQYKKSINDEIKKLTEETKIDEVRQIRANELIKPINDVKEGISNEIQSTLDMLNSGVDYESNAQDSAQDSTQNPQTARDSQDSQNLQSLSYKKSAKSIKSAESKSAKSRSIPKTRSPKQADSKDSSNLKATKITPKRVDSTFTKSRKSRVDSQPSVEDSIKITKATKSPKVRAKITQK